MKIRGAYRSKALQKFNYVLFSQNYTILNLQSVSRDVADNVSHPRRLDPTLELIKYSFVLYLQHGRHDVKCKPSIMILIVQRKKTYC